jgi:hypothetical protein
MSGAAPVSNSQAASASAAQPTTPQFVKAGRSVKETSALPLPPRLNAHSWPRAAASNTPRPMSLSSNSTRHKTPLEIGGGPQRLRND